MNKLIILVMFLNAVLFPQEIKENVNKALENCFGKNIQIHYEKIKIEQNLKNEIEKMTGQKFFADEVYFYKIFDNEHLTGMALLDNVYGKSLPITFIVMFDTNGKILCSEIVKYREHFGGAIQSKDWNSQFIGKDDKSDYVIGKDIKSISGATISVNSVTKGIKKLSLLINYLKKK